MGRDLRQGHVLDVLRTMPDESVHCVITSPPYWRLRAYGTEPQVWGGRTDCEHRFEDSAGAPVINGSLTRKQLTNAGSYTRLRPELSGGGLTAWRRAEAFQPAQTCSLCGAWRGELGSEPTIELYLEHLVEVFRAVRRVLRSDGIAWVDIGDSYAGKDLCLIPERLALALQADGWWVRRKVPWLKRNPMPESTGDRPTVAIEDIWFLSKSGAPKFWTRRDGLPGQRRQPKPDYRWYDRLQGVEVETEPPGGWKDELLPADASLPGSWGFEVLADDDEEESEEDKRKRWRRINLWSGHDYFWDAEAVRVGSVADHSSGNKQRRIAALGQHDRTNTHLGSSVPWDKKPMRSRRDADWFFESWQGLLLDEAGDPLALVVNPKGFKGAHFATFPPKLVEPMIKASTSALGACVECGAPWASVVDKKVVFRSANPADTKGGVKGVPPENRWGGTRKASLRTTTTGWASTCAHADGLIGPCVVLDPFAGSGTVLFVAQELGRDSIGIELKPGYCAMAEKRLAGARVPLPGLAEWC